jgi:hypothetical protein
MRVVSAMTIMSCVVVMPHIRRMIYRFSRLRRVFHMVVVVVLMFGVIVVIAFVRMHRVIEVIMMIALYLFRYFGIVFHAAAPL